MALDRQQIIERLEEAGGPRDLSGLDLSGADLSRLDLRGVNLSRADLTSADMRWAVLEGADLDATVLRRADLRWAVLRGAGLRDADLARANLGWADLTEADLSGADLDGANLDTATLDQAILDMPGRRGRSAPRPAPRAAGPAAERAPMVVPIGGGITLPAWSPAMVVAALAALLALVYLWGWLFRRAYLEGGFGLADAGLVELGDATNLVAGFTRVVTLELGVLLLAPLFLVALLLVAAIVAAVPLVLAYLSERILADVVRPEVRPFVIGGLFVAMTVFFVLFLGPAISFAREASAAVVPESESLSAVFTLARIGGWLTRIGYVAVLGLAGVALWVCWRAFAHFLAGYQLPVRWRLRYPAMDAGLIALRDSRLLAGSGPLTETERRRGWLAAAALVVLLGTVLAGTGQVYAYRDMCDGGDLARGQVYVGGPPADAGSRAMCERLLAETPDRYYVFFPHQTSELEAGDVSSRVANVQAIALDATITFYEAVDSADDCPTCVDSPEDKSATRSRFVVDPAEVEVGGTVLEHTGDLVTLDVPGGQVGTVRLSATTTVLQDGQSVAAGTIQPGLAIIAIGRLATDAPMLDARVVDIVPQTTPIKPAVLTASLADPQGMVIGGSEFRAGGQVAIGLAPAGATAPQVPLVLEPVTVAADGTFSVPVRWRDGLPTGPGWQVIARDPTNGKSASAPWLQAPPAPTPTPRPSPTAFVIEEATMTPQGEGPSATPAAPEGTNTPMPTRLLPGGGTTGGADCQGDEFEPDWPRGFEKEIYVGFGETGSTQKHTFCGTGPGYKDDIDLVFFTVKRDRWYRVKTTNLAPGVDTVMAVGDLSNSTMCQPAGCWSDDRSALTYESEILFKTVEDGRAMITVDNRGSAYGSAASYDLAVSEFVPEPTATPTLAATATASPTPTATRTPLPFKDNYEVGNRCREGEIYGPPTVADYLRVNESVYAVISDRNDDDYFEIEPLVGNVTYEVFLSPPKNQDYDLELLKIDTKTACQGVTKSTLYGEGTDELIRFPAQPGLRYAVRVYSAYAGIYFDAYNPYELLVRTLGGAVPTPTLSPTPTSTPSPTATATRTPPPPTSEDDVLPPKPTATPGFAP